MSKTTDIPKRENAKALAAAERGLEAQIEEVGRVTPPDGGYGWVVVAASFLVNMAVDGVIYTCGKILLPVWAVKFNSASLASFAISLLAGCYYLSGPLASAFVNVFGIRPVAISGSIVATTAFLLSRFCTEAWQYYIVFGALGGIGFGCLYLPSIVILSTYFSKKRSMATGIAVCGSGIGTVIFSQLNEVIWEFFNKEADIFMVYLAAIAISGGLFSIFFAPLQASDRQVARAARIVQEYEGTGQQEASRELLEAVRNDLDELNRPGHQTDTFFAGNTPIARSRCNSIDKKEEEAARHVIHVTDQHTVEHVSKKGRFAEIKDSLLSIYDKDLLFSPSFLTLAISGTLTLISFLVPFIYLAELMAIHQNIPASARSLPLSLIGAFNIICRVLCGIVSDHPKISALQVSNISAVIAGCSMLLVPFCSELWHFILFCVPFSAGVACFAALRSVICVELVGVEKLSNAFGILMVFMGIGALAGPPVAAGLKDLTGSFNLSFYVMGSIFAFSGIMLIRLPQLKEWEEKKKRAMGGTEMRTISQASGDVQN